MRLSAELEHISDKLIKFVGSAFDLFAIVDNAHRLCGCRDCFSVEGIVRSISGFLVVDREAIGEVDREHFIHIPRVDVQVIEVTAVLCIFFVVSDGDEFIGNQVDSSDRSCVGISGLHVHTDCRAGVDSNVHTVDDLIGDRDGEGGAFNGELGCFVERVEVAALIGNDRKGIFANFSIFRNCNGQSTKGGVVVVHSAGPEVDTLRIVSGETERVILVVCAFKGSA